MIIRILLIFFLWLLLRRIWRTYLVSRNPSEPRRGPYPGPNSEGQRGGDLGDITQQEISDAEFEEIDDN